MAAEYKISDMAIRKRISSHTKPIKAIANQLATAEIALERLPISSQCKVRSLVDTLKGISFHISNAAEYSAKTSHRLSRIANAQVEKIDETNPLGNIDVIKEIAAITDVSNKAASIALNLMAANKWNGFTTSAQEDAPQITHDRYAEIAKAALDEY